MTSPDYGTGWHRQGRSKTPFCRFEFCKVFSWIFPSTFGINGFVRINNMGATLPEVLVEYQALWIQAIVYFFTTCIVYRRQIILSRRHAMERLRMFRLRKLVAKTSK